MTVFLYYDVTEGAGYIESPSMCSVEASMYVQGVGGFLRGGGRQMTG
jgi:hypothetical protein